jgi:hypothetical protein
MRSSSHDENDEDFDQQILNLKESKRIRSNIRTNLRKGTAHLPPSAFKSVTSKNEITKEQVRNQRLVTLLKEKIFKGYMKVKEKDDIIKSEKCDVSALYVNGKKFKVRKKKYTNKNPKKIEEEIDFLKIEKYPVDLLYKEIIKDDKNNRNKFNSTNYTRFYLTENRPLGFFNSTPKTKHDDEYYKILNRIFNNNIEEAKHYNNFPIIALEVKKTKENAYGKINKSILEKEILNEIEKININNAETKDNFFGKTDNFNLNLKSQVLDENRRSQASFNFRPTNQLANAQQIRPQTHVSHVSNVKSTSTQYNNTLNNDKKITEEPKNLASIETLKNNLEAPKETKPSKLRSLSGAPSDVFTTNLNERMMMTNYANTHFPNRNEHSIKAFKSIKNKIPNLVKEIVREQKSAQVRRINNFHNTEDYREIQQRQYTGEFDELLNKQRDWIPKKFNKTCNFDKLQIDILNVKKERFKKIHDLAFNTDNDVIGQKKRNVGSGNSPKRNIYSGSTRRDDKNITLDDKLRDYKVSKQLYKIFNKDEVDTNVLGRKK